MKELNLGLVFPDPFNLDSAAIADAMYQVLNEKTYLENMLRMCALSRKQNGSVNGAEEIIRQLEKKDN